MPLIGSRLADEAGLALVRDWIRSLPMARGRSDDGIEASLARGDVPKLLATTGGALALIEHLAGKSEIRDLKSQIMAAVPAHTNAFIRDLCQRLLPPDRRRPTLGADIHPETILALRGHAGRGRALFTGASQCSRCHVCAGEGRAFGPELTFLGRKYSRAQLLDQILNPSKVIAPEFRTAVLTLRDGDELTGFVVKRTAAEWVLRDETLKEHTVRLSDVKESRESTLSAMPEGLLAPLTAQEAADLLEFLAVGGAPAR
jgi:putative heme-binding domain-containing protein